MRFYEFTRWWAYRRIIHSRMNTYVWWTPLFFTTIMVGVYALLPAKPVLAGADGLLRGLSQIFALLPGFFISALAAVATFNRPEMDEPMPGEAPRMLIRHQGRKVEIHLTRRMFLSYLFSYLAVVSIILFCVTIVSPYLYIPIANHIRSLDISFIVTLARYSFVFVLCYFSSSLLVTTLHGIYFLTERMHMPNT